jgi:hypothetical protein
MEWIKFTGAVGIGAIATKLLDIVWLQRSLRESERRKWLRERKLEVYSELSAELLSLGRKSDLRNDAFEGYALASKAILLTEDDELAHDIERFFTWLANLFKEAARPTDLPGKRPEEVLEGAYEQLYKESRRLVKELRKSLHKI